MQTLFPQMTADAGDPGAQGGPLPGQRLFSPSPAAAPMQQAPAAQHPEEKEEPQQSSGLFNPWLKANMNPVVRQSMMDLDKGST